LLSLSSPRRPRRLASKRQIEHREVREHDFDTVAEKDAYLTPKIGKLVAFKERSLTVKKEQGFAQAFHAACVQELLPFIDRMEARFHCSELAATCLPRSYEIINGNAPFPRLRSGRSAARQLVKRCGLSATVQS
jgi:hypothetical protein